MGTIPRTQSLIETSDLLTPSSHIALGTTQIAIAASELSINNQDNRNRNEFQIDVIAKAEDPLSECSDG